MRRSVHNHGFQKRLPEDFRALVCCWQAKDHWLCCAVPSSPVKRTKVRSGWQMGRIKLEWILCRGCSGWHLHCNSATSGEPEPFCTSENTQRKRFHTHFQHDLLWHLLAWPTLDWFWFYLAKPCSPPRMDISSVRTYSKTTPPSWWKLINFISFTQFIKVGKDLQEHKVQIYTNAFPIAVLHLPNWNLMYHGITGSFGLEVP